MNTKTIVIDVTPEDIEARGFARLPGPIHVGRSNLYVILDGYAAVFTASEETGAFMDALRAGLPVRAARLKFREELVLQ